METGTGDGCRRREVMIFTGEEMERKGRANSVAGELGRSSSWEMAVRAGNGLRDGGG